MDIDGSTFFQTFYVSLCRAIVHDKEVQPRIPVGIRILFIVMSGLDCSPAIFFRNE